jgi:hypothetical protein
MMSALCVLLATGFAGCSWFTIGGGGPAYGMPIVPLDIKSFSYTSASPVHVGDTLTFIAELEPAGSRTAVVYAGNVAPRFRVQLHDDGQTPDAAEGDDVFSGSGPWLAANGTGETQALLHAEGFKHGEYASGDESLPLEVLP